MTAKTQCNTLPSGTFNAELLHNREKPFSSDARQIFFMLYCWARLCTTFLATKRTRPLFLRLEILYLRENLPDTCS